MTVSSLKMLTSSMPGMVLTPSLFSVLCNLLSSVVVVLCTAFFFLKKPQCSLFQNPSNCWTQHKYNPEWIGSKAAYWSWNRKFKTEVHEFSWRETPSQNTFTSKLQKLQTLKMLKTKTENNPPEKEEPSTKQQKTMTEPRTFFTLPQESVKKILCKKERSLSLPQNLRTLNSIN